MIKLPAYFLGFNSKSDGSAGLRFASQEITSEDFAELKRNLNNFGWLLFQENTLSVSDLPKEPAEEDKDKSPSKRLRAVLFLNWKKKKEGDFETYYRKMIEVFIDKVKEKLE